MTTNTLVAKSPFNTITSGEKTGVMILLIFIQRTALRCAFMQQQAIEKSIKRQFYFDQSSISLNFQQCQIVAYHGRRPLQNCVKRRCANWLTREQQTLTRGHKNNSFHWPKDRHTTRYWQVFQLAWDGTRWNARNNLLVKLKWKALRNESWSTNPHTDVCRRAH